MVSPLLFTFYIYDFVKDLETKGCKGIYLSPECQNLLALLYADGIVDTPDTVGRIQRYIDVLRDFCDKWVMTVSTKKTKVMVCRNGGPFRKNEQFYFKGRKVQTVSYYKYLGVLISTRISWSAALVNQAAKAQKVISMLKGYEKRCGRLSYSVAFHMFDNMILPILFYGSEVWGTHVDLIEKVQVKFCKYFLGLPGTAANAATLGECGRLPLMVYYIRRCIKSWTKLLPGIYGNRQIPSTVLSYVIYRLDQAGRITWVRGILT